MGAGRGAGSGLVNAAGIAIRGGGVTVPFGGVHLDGRESDALGALIELASKDPWCTPAPHPRSALAVRIGRASFAVIVGGRGSPARGRQPAQAGGEFHGKVGADLTFVYDAPRSTEGMVVFGPGPPRPPSYEAALRLGRTLNLVAGLATARGAPLEFMYSPASPPPRGSQGSRGDGSREQWRWDSRACLRFSVAMPAPSPRRRLDLHHELLDYCAAQGFAFHLADRRFPGVGGRWFELLSGGAGEDSAGAPIKRVVPVTVVGPVRVGTTKAVIAQLLAVGIGVVGASITALGEVALINLVLPLPVRRARDADAQDPPASHQAAATLDWLGRAYGATAEELPAAAAALLSDYLCFVGAPRPPEAAANRRALWVSWEAPASSDGLIAFADAMRAAMLEVELAGETDLTAEQLILRCVSEDLARGRGKLSVGWKGKRGPDRANESARLIAISLEGACRRHLARLVPTLAPSIDVQVSPHQSLLGRWHTPAALI